MARVSLHTRIVFALAAFFVLRTINTTAQQFTTDSIHFPLPKQFSFGFSRNVNTYLWDLRGGYLLRGQDWSIEATDRFQSSLIKTDQNFIRDDNTVQLRGNKSIAASLELTAQVNSSVFSDQRAIALNSLASHTFLGGLSWTPIQNIIVTPLAGYKLDSQLGVGDHGFAYNANAELLPLSFGKYIASGMMNIIGEYLDPRLLEERHLTTTLQANFSSDADNRSQIEYRKLRRDFYLPTDSVIQKLYGVNHPIESRNENIFFINDQLRYRISNPLQALLSVELMQRTISKKQKYIDFNAPLPIFDSEINEFRMNGNFVLQYNNNERTKAEFRVGLNGRDERYSINPILSIDPLLYTRQQKIEDQKNNSINQTQLGISFNHALSSIDTILCAASTVKMVYNTPSETNYDDRDELFFLFNAGWIHRFSELFSARILSEVNLRHTVYIFGQRSANNLWNRVFRLVSSTEYVLPNILQTKNFAEVIANYSVYDFEDITQSAQSFSLRQMTIGDSSSIRLSGNIWFTGCLQIRLYEQGELHWSSFTMRPLNYFDERTVSMYFTLEKNKYRIAPGFRFFQQTRYRYNNNLDKIFESEIISIGPTCHLEVVFSSGARIFLDGWYQITHETNITLRKVPNITMNVMWNL